MIIVTGGAGFIGCNLVRALNRRGLRDIVVVDDLSDGRKFANLVGCDIADYWDKARVHRATALGRDRPARNDLPSRRLRRDNGMGRAVHDGDELPLLRGPARVLPTRARTFDLCVVRRRLRRKHGIQRRRLERGAAAQRLRILEIAVRSIRATAFAVGARSQVVGLRYFNVYGPYEAHKGPMASVAYHLNRQMIEQLGSAAIRRQRWLRGRRAASRFRVRRGRRARESVVLRAPPRVGHLQRGNRQECELQRSSQSHHRLARRRQDPATSRFRKD